MAAPKIEIGSNGLVTADGQDGNDGGLHCGGSVGSGGGGGGSDGGVIVFGDDVVNSGQISAKGGAGGGVGTSGSGGDGANGADGIETVII